MSGRFSSNFKFLHFVHFPVWLKSNLSLCSVFIQLLVGATVRRCKWRESFDFIINQTFHFNLYLIHRIILIKLRQCRISLYHWMQCLHVHVTAACTCKLHGWIYYRYSVKLYPIIVHVTEEFLEFVLFLSFGVKIQEISGVVIGFF